MKDISIRPAKREDFETWFSYRKELWSVPDEKAERKEMEEVFTSGRKEVFIVEKKGKGPIGYVETSLRDYAEGCSTSPVGYVEGWYVASDYRGQGIGRMLIEHAEQWARDMDCSEIASDAELDNEISIAAHKKLGFTETGRGVTFLKKL